MTGIEVSAATLDSLRTTLTSASDALESTGHSVPHRVDGGLLAAELTTILADVVGSAAAVSDALAGAASAVRDTATDYRVTDADVATGFGPTGSAR